MADLSTTLGVIEVSALVSAFLCGISTVQAWNYFRVFPEDSIGLKLFVASVYVLDFAQSLFLMSGVFYYTIQHFGEVEPLLHYCWQFEVSLYILGAVAFAVQSFYCLRVLRITESWILAAGCFSLTVARLVLNLIIATNIVRLNSFTAVQTQLNWNVDAVLVTGAASDIAIAACMVISLLKHRSGFVVTDKLVDRVIAYIVGSGLLTSVVAIVELICYLAMPHNYVWMSFTIILAKLFSNSLLASLNERRYLREMVLGGRASVMRDTISLPASHVHVMSGGARPNVDAAAEPRALRYSKSAEKELEMPHDGHTDF